MSHAIKTLPDIAVGTTPVQVKTPNNPGGIGSTSKWHSVTVQNNGAGTLYVGDSLVSATRKAAALATGQSYAIVGSAVDPAFVWLVASAATTATVSGT
jgi:hypothetical protein